MKTIKDLFLRPDHSVLEELVILAVLHLPIAWYFQTLILTVILVVLSIFVTKRYYKVRDV